MPRWPTPKGQTKNKKGPILGQIIHGDCLDILSTLPKSSVDMVLTDLPYGSTACAWDAIIPFVPMWTLLSHVCKEKAAIVFFASQPFTTMLISSNFQIFKYCWTWEKNFSTNFYHAKRMPLRRTEDLVVFYKTQPTYNPQRTSGHVPTQSARGASDGVLYHGVNARDYAGGDTTRSPINILRFDAVDPKNRLHPSQKPTELLAYLIRTYSDCGDTVLDFAAGSCSTAVAARNEGRNFICIEKETKYVDLARKRLSMPVVRQEQLEK